jgi:hypothetical protein
MLVPFQALPDQPRLEVPEPVAAAQPVHDLVSGPPHGVGVDRPPSGIQVSLEVHDVCPGDPAEAVFQPLEPLPRITRFPGGAFQEEPELIDVHADNGKQVRQTMLVLQLESQSDIEAFVPLRVRSRRSAR